MELVAATKAAGEDVTLLRCLHYIVNILQREIESTDWNKVPTSKYCKYCTIPDFENFAHEDFRQLHSID
jgi:hypothetical protein